MQQLTALQVLLLTAFAAVAAAKCPLGHLAHLGAAGEAVWAGRSLLQQNRPTVNTKAVEALDVSAVTTDLKALLTDSQPWWPADNNHYGGLLIRLAWHCSGSYRTWDGRGGCNGARIRFSPELAWEDNTNLDKARRLLEPVKAKYGEVLSWGDLIVLAGNAAIESMGGPNIGVCLGRIDDVDGVASLPLGPTPEQQRIAPCTKGDGMCEQPLGQTTMGLIYVNAEGVQGNPVPENSVAHIRETFSRMGMNDQETVALIGGGHAFGKTHGACAMGPGPGPKESPDNPWPGTCGSGPMQGKGPNTYTSGFEGSWTSTPTKWSNKYFHNLLSYDWEKYMGPGGHWQWRPTRKPGAAQSDTSLPSIIMLTSDIALLKDPVYLGLVQEYASDFEGLTNDFGNAWYKLTTRSMGPVSRCLGRQVPPPQAFQMPLPAPSPRQPNWSEVRAEVITAMTSGKRSSSPVLLADTHQGKPHLGAQFATVAFQCASTFRATDFLGGCNGARIRFEPQKSWPSNSGLVDEVVKRLQPVKSAHPDLSWADLLVLAGTIAVEQAAGVKPSAGQTVAGPFSFCPGRSDADSGAGMEQLAPRSYSTPEVAFKDNAAVMGLTAREAVALAARPRSPAHQLLLGFSGTWALQPKITLSNDYFKLLIDLNWTKRSGFGREEYMASGEDAARVLNLVFDFEMEGQSVYMTPEDLVIKQDPDLAAIARSYTVDNQMFLAEFAAAWTKVMNADRFMGPAGNACSSGMSEAPAAAGRATDLSDSVLSEVSGDVLDVGKGRGAAEKFV